MTEQKEDLFQEDAATPEDVLKSALSRFNELGEEARQALVRKEPEIRQQKLVERAELIVDLPDRIRKVLETGERFSEQELERLETFAQLAKEGLEAGNDFALDTLLVRKGTKVGEPNLLKEMVNRLYPSRKIEDKTE